MFFQRLVAYGDAGIDAFQVFGSFGGGQARGCGYQVATVLGQAESRYHIRNALVIHLALGIADPVEGKPADQTGGHSQGNRAAEGQI